LSVTFWLTGRVPRFLSCWSGEGLKVKLREDLNALTPRLRRYARALMSGDPGGSERADDLVHATLIRALGSRNLGAHSDLVIRLYATLTQMHRGIAGGQTGDAPAAIKPMAFGTRVGMKPASTLVRQSKLTTSLMSLPLEDREALLLVALENFDHDEAARILHVTKTVLLARLTRARIAMEAQLQIHAGAPRSLDHDRPQVSHLRLVK
jgi:RNA polymerase sigma-70 factor (ECF subfamily)